jgi:hypothetical protein
MRNIFEVGDKVEVRLISKQNNLYYSKNLTKLSEFKENLVKDIFLILSDFKQIQQPFIIGSFLTENIEFNDIDILIITDKNI